MNTDGNCKWAGLVVVLGLASPIGWGRVRHENAQVSISVYNDAEVAREVLLQGEGEARRVFRHAGIEVKWLNCKGPGATETESQTCREAVYPVGLELRIVQKALNAKGEALGISFLQADGRGCCADLFYEPMEELHRSKGTDIATLLGLVAAHEAGHLLLGTNSHSVAGIMHAHWTAQELASIPLGRLVFLDKEARAMKERLFAGQQPPQEASPIDAARISD